MEAVGQQRARQGASRRGEVRGGLCALGIWSPNLCSGLKAAGTKSLLSLP